MLFALMSLIQADTAVVKRGSIEVTREAAGTFAPAASHEVRIQFEAYSGEAKILSAVAHGAAVKKGQTVLSLSSDIEWSLQEARWELDGAKEQLAAARNAKTFGDEQAAMAAAAAARSLAEAKEALEYFDSTERKTMEARADMSLQWSVDSVADQEEELRQLEKMYASEDLTSDTAEIVVMRARRGLENSKKNLDMGREDLRRTKEVEIPRRRVSLEESLKQSQLSHRQLQESQKIEAADRDRGVARAELALKRVERNFARLQADAERMTVEAPVDGVVYYGGFQMGMWGDLQEWRRRLRGGEPAPVGEVSLTIVQPDTLTVRLTPEEAHLLDFKAGQSAEIKPTASREKLKGRVEAIEMGTVVLDVDGAATGLRPGLTCNVKIPIGKREGVLLVPTKAVTDKTVTVVNGEVDESRAVVVGDSDATHTEILEGLKEGETVRLK